MHLYYFLNAYKVSLAFGLDIPIRHHTGSHIVWWFPVSWSCFKALGHEEISKGRGPQIKSQKEWGCGFRRQICLYRLFFFFMVCFWSVVFLNSDRIGAKERATKRYALMFTSTFIFSAILKAIKLQYLLVLMTLHPRAPNKWETPWTVLCQPGQWCFHKGQGAMRWNQSMSLARELDQREGRWKGGVLGEQTFPPLKDTLVIVWHKKTTHQTPGRLINSCPRAALDCQTDPNTFSSSLPISHPPPSSLSVYLLLFPLLSEL